MSRESLLPKSLFSASTLKLEPVEESLHNLMQQRKKRTDGKPPQNYSIFDSDEEQQDDEEEEPILAIKATNNRNDTSSSSSSSSSSEDEQDDLSLQQPRNTSTQTINTLLIKLERQQARQNRYLLKVKQLNKSIKKTNRILLSYHANLLLVENNVPPSTAPVVREMPQLAKRSAPFETNVRVKQRKIAIEEDEDDDSVQYVTPPPPPMTMTTRVTTKKTIRPTFPVQRPNRTTKKALIEIDFASKENMDFYTIRRKTQEIMATKKPRSLLYNIANNNMDRGMSELMISTSLDGELQFWNSVERRKIKTIGKNHLYDSWIDDICWATPSTLAFCPGQKSNEPVKLVHIGSVSKNNVEGRIQALTEDPHEGGVSVIASLDTGTYASRNSETCSFVTGGYDKSVYVWSLKRESPADNFVSNGVHRLNIKHTSAVYSLCYDKFRNILCSGGSDERLNLFDMQSTTTIRELRLPQRVSQIIQSKANPNILLITTTNRADQFSIYDQRIPGLEGVKLKFGQNEQDTLSRFIRPDMHENGYMVCCGSQGQAKLNFWDLRYTHVSQSTSFGMDTQAVTRSLRTMFLPNQQDTIVSLSSSKYITWIDYHVKKDEIVKNLTL